MKPSGETGDRGVWHEFKARWWWGVEVREGEGDGFIVFFSITFSIMTTSLHYTFVEFHSSL